MRRIRILCLSLALLLVLGGCLAVAGDAAALDSAEWALSDAADEDAFEMPEILALSGAGEEANDGETAGEAAESPEEGSETPGTGEEEQPGDREETTEEPAEESTELTALILPETVSIGVGEKLRLRPEPVPAGAVYGLSFTGGGEFASVSDDGVVRGLKKNGEQTVVVTADNGVTASVKVAVKAAPKKVTLKASTKHLEVGETVQLTYKLPKKTAGSCTFSAEKNDILTVTPEGLVTALSPGTVKITGTTYNGKKGTIKVTVLPPFQITFMNIGRNDGILIRCGGESAFIDSGTHGRGVQAAKYMKKQDVKHLKYYIGTHAHKDHVGGAPAIIAAIKTDTVIVSHSGTKSAIKKYAETSAERKALKKVKFKVMKRGKTFTLSSAVFEVLGPVKLVHARPTEVAENGNSLILKLTFGENTFLLTGDASGSELSDVQKKNPGCMKVQVLKNPHHHGKQEYAVKKAKPKITVISTGSSDLPTSDYVRFIKKRGSKVYITASNRNGHVTISSDGVNLTVNAEKIKTERHKSPERLAALRAFALMCAMDRSDLRQFLLHLVLRGDGHRGAHAGDADGRGHAGAAHALRQGPPLGQAADEVAGEGVAGGGGVHGVGPEGLLAHGLHAPGRHLVGDAAGAAQGDQHREAGVLFVQRVPGPLGLVAAGALAGLDLVHQQPGQLAEVHFLQAVVEGGGVQHDAHAPGMGGVHDLGHAVDFVLQHQPVALAEVGQGLLHLGGVDAAVRAAVEQYAVLALAVHLDDGVALHAVDGLQPGGVHAVGLQ